MSTGWVAAGSAVLGAASSMSAADKAASAQGKAGSAANAMTQEQFNATRIANNYAQQNGMASSNLLAALMGTADDVPQYTYEQLMAQEKPHHYTLGSITGKRYSSKKLASAAVNKLLAEQKQRNKLIAELKANGQFGSLLKNFEQEDLDNDVVYQSGLQFGLDQGTQGVNRLVAASGNFKSGATLKALTRFGNDYASTKAGDAYNRFNNDKSQTYNMLSGQAGAGQVATNNVSSAGQNMAQSMGQNMIGMGNARAASAIGQANALTGAIGQGFNMYQQNRLYNSLMDQ